MINETIGIVGGNGWLGNAIAAALVSSGTVDPSRLILSGRTDNRGKADLPGVHWTRDNRELAERAEVIVLSVRPAQFPEVRISAANKLVVSVMAGVPSQTIASRTGSDRVVRSIPNAAAAIGRSFTPWHASESVTAADKAIVQELFEACGEAAEVPLEAHIDYCVGMTGSGAAFPALLAEAMVADAVSQGLPRLFAQKAAKGTIAGSSQLFASASEDTAAIVQEMIDYRGTTAAALETMLAQGFNDAVAAGLAAALTKARNMG